MLQSGAYFEEKGYIDKAVDLYKKGGNLRKAYDMAIKANYKEEADKIAQMLEVDSSQSYNEPSSATGGGSQIALSLGGNSGGGGGEDQESMVETYINRGQPERAIPVLINLK